MIIRKQGVITDYKLVEKEGCLHFKSSIRSFEQRFQFYTAVSELRPILKIVLIFLFRVSYKFVTYRGIQVAIAVHCNIKATFNSFNKQKTISYHMHLKFG